jgi:hypothetical protein
MKHFQSTTTVSKSSIYRSTSSFCLIHSDDGAHNTWRNIGTPLTYDAATRIAPSIYVLHLMWDTVSHPHKQQVGETSVKRRTRARRWFRAILLPCCFQTSYVSTIRALVRLVFTPLSATQCMFCDETSFSIVLCKVWHRMLTIFNQIKFSKTIKNYKDIQHS